MNRWILIMASVMAGLLIATSCVTTTNCNKDTRRIWITISAEKGDGPTIAEIMIDGNMVCNIENFADFQTPDKGKQVGYFPLKSGLHTIEAKANGFKPWSKKLEIIPGEEGVQNLHIYLERLE